MDINITFSGVAVAGMPASFRAVETVAKAAYFVPQRLAEHPTAHAAGAGWPAAAAVAPQRKRRPAAANRASVDWSPL
ncbi:MULTISPECIES: hypothetical protein [Mycolicibacterium]|uniref:hypothetical protein n=1 Tax=Mycolicibacterium TaxID=1866885 RepID=UPI000A8A9E5F|nr:MULTISPECIES: hypothetical protein [Mycolicibacterium]MCV7284387.1 hypothetical protein [Mycolicibacterium wolinskyi]MCV7298009.1 hypothetical protein [Mycolicibacterium goodii]